MTKRQDLYLQRRSRSEQSDQRQPNQAANISHQPRASPDSTALTSRIEFPTMTTCPHWLRSTRPVPASTGGAGTTSAEFKRIAIPVWLIRLGRFEGSSGRGG